MSVYGSNRRVDDVSVYGTNRRADDVSVHGSNRRADDVSVYGSRASEKDDVVSKQVAVLRPVNHYGCIRAKKEVEDRPTHQYIHDWLTNESRR